MDIEVKTSTGKQSAAQALYAAHVTLTGGVYLLVRDVDGAIATIRRLIE